MEFKSKFTSNKSHNALDKYLTTRHFVTEMCTHVHFLSLYGALCDMGLVHCVLCATGLLYFLNGLRISATILLSKDDIESDATCENAFSQLE